MSRNNYDTITISRNVKNESATYKHRFREIRAGVFHAVKAGDNR